MKRTSRNGDTPAGHGRPHSGADPRVCSGCRDQVEEDLVDLPELYELCTFTLVLDGHGPGSAHPLVALQEETLRVLAVWAGRIAGWRGVTAPAEPCVRRLTSFLAIHLDWLVTHPSAAEFAHALDERVSTIRDVLRPLAQYRSLSRNEK